MPNGDKKADGKKSDDVDIEKLKTFKMPKKAPNFEGKKTES